MLRETHTKRWTPQCALPLFKSKTVIDVRKVRARRSTPHVGVAQVFEQRPHMRDRYRIKTPGWILSGKLARF
jgi:hypothetical protein